MSTDPQSSRKILLIDDQQLFLHACTSVLNNYGYKVTSCEDPMQALELLKQSDYFLVLCDLYMESFSGYKLLYRFLKEKPEQICCVISSAETNDSLLTKTLNLDNVKGMIKKPVSYEKLHAFIQSLTVKDTPTTSAN